MSDCWPVIVKQYRARHALSQLRFAALVGVSQRTVSRWERAEDSPGLLQQRRLRDLMRQPGCDLLASLRMAVRHCPVPRALSRTPRLTLLAVSPPAVAKRPSVVDMIGSDLAPLACGVLEEMLADGVLQSALAKGQIAAVVATSSSVLRTVEHPRIGTYHTTISYFFHDGTLYSDAVSVPARADAACGYRVVPIDALAS